MSTPDDVDIAGIAYLATEYDDLARLIDELPCHDERAQACRDKRDDLARHFAHYLSLDLTGEELLEQMRLYREQHSGDTLAYLARSENT